MKNPFAKKGFDSLISPEIRISGGVMTISGDEHVVFDGILENEKICELATDRENSKVHLTIGGSVNTNELELQNLTITGTLTAGVVKVRGVLAIKAGARVTIDVLQYRHLVIETGAIVNANMQHMDGAANATKVPA
jgi:hypothetical protein